MTASVAVFMALITEHLCVFKLDLISKIHKKSSQKVSQV